MQSRQVLGVIGAGMLFVGVFAPLVSVPVMGTVNYFQNGRGDGVFILVLAAVSIVLAVSERYRGLWLTGFGTVAVLVFTFVNFHMRLSEMKQQMDVDLADNPFRGLADLAMESVQLQWGWALLILGTILLLVAAALKPPHSTAVPASSPDI